ncbi:helix-turn-helix domain-containing protein [Actinomadura rugatobispora]|uniref:Helix-turn-helix domain-containing protein n=1 Tax=Actinomadura rugatobispora TaxID=1994 RepID=A0ABW1ADF3_9ACTN
MATGEPAASWAEAALGRLRRGMDGLDALLGSGADLEAVVRRAAGSFGFAMGVRTADGTVVSGGRDGSLSAGPPPPGARCRRLPGGSHVWLHSGDGTAPENGEAPASAGGSPADLEELVLRCFGDAVERTIARSGERQTAADIHTAVDGLASAEDRRHALRRLGLRDRAPVMLLALAGPAAGVERVLGQIRTLAPVVHHVRDDRVHLVLADGLGGVRELHMPLGVRGAFTPPGPASRAPEAWRHARNALRFALPSTRETGPYRKSEAVLVDSSALGSYAILAEQLGAEGLAQVPDVQRLAQLLRDSGPEMERTLLAVAATDSLRQAARTVHLHHNSVAHRVQRAEKVLGFSCTVPYGRARLLLTLTLHRLLESHKLF